MIVEDSPVVMELLKYIIGNDSRLEVAATATSAEDALQKLNRVRPDVISLDIRLPGMNGLDATLLIMSSRPTPIVVVSAGVQEEELNIAMNAMRAGALTVVEKPVGVTNGDYETMAGQLCDQLAVMSQVKVVRQAGRRNIDFGAMSAKSSTAKESGRHFPTVAPKIIGIVASTGGPNAVSRVLNGLGRDFPLPILAVQHITDGFLTGFVSWLCDITPFTATIAKDGECPAPGKVYFPPEDTHLEIRDGRLRVNGGALVSTQRPSGTVLLKSIAHDQGTHALGVLLTGMGSDGAKGLLAIKQAGGYTIAESESTAVIYGMPAEAVRLGGVCESLPLDAIAPGILEMVATKAQKVR
ncbi:MAG: chemotaxis response regulator protein-glutamate methylesterase [Rhodospirillales bacterium RIFCSPLOWO2_12_FULL_58_28]|nr:MAG: chemotaxis response regulator protein-glutamate methylesterase [Rhodospirillales bacterium RIFCSPLOWO2_02_FULL_58_16]OHC78107.1 MAG: chemotaxis response regulator protein-glutamate methylesterase [Rhodospirillales bacterium RIFCSPLOWO2_12_FULL_58_28]